MGNSDPTRRGSTPANADTGEGQDQGEQEHAAPGLEEGEISEKVGQPIKEEGPINRERSAITLELLRIEANIEGNFKGPDLTTPPPPRPSHYNSVLFPAMELLSGECPSRELKNMSLNYIKAEQKAFEDTRSKSLKFTELYSSKRRGKPFCIPCSEYCEDPKGIWHHHYSSKLVRMRSEMDSYGLYKCEQCIQSPHYAVTGARQPVLITSSWMHDHWGKREGVPYRGDDLHLDVSSTPGARIRDLTRAYRSLYSDHPIPVDAIVCGGIDNILGNEVFTRVSLGEVENQIRWLEDSCREAVREIFKEIDELQKAVLTSAPKSETNSFAMATLPIPPMLAWSDNPNSPEGRGANIIRGLKIQMINSLNAHVKEINRSNRDSTKINTASAPSFVGWGCKRRATCQNELADRVDPQSEALGPYFHRLSHYREANPKEMLHFNGYVKVKMARSILRYFKGLYLLEPSLGENKQEGVARLEALKTLPDHKRRVEDPKFDRGIFWDKAYDRCKTQDVPPVPK